MEKWLADRPHHPGEAAKQLLVNLYKNNELIRGEFKLGDRTVDLADIRVPVLNVFAKDENKEKVKSRPLPVMGRLAVVAPQKGGK